MTLLAIARQSKHPNPKQDLADTKARVDRHKGNGWQTQKQWLLSGKLFFYL